MSIDWLLDLERSIDNGKEVYACQGMGRNEWIIGKPLQELQRIAKKAAEHKKFPINIVRLISKFDTTIGDLYLVPTTVEDPGPRGEPHVKWSTIENREAADMMRDVKFGPAPYFGMQVVQTVNPTSTI